MHRHVLVQGSVYHKSVAGTFACALFIHDREGVQPFDVQLIVQSFTQVGIDVLECALCNMPQPIRTQTLQQAWQWLTESFHYPQIGIGIGIGAHLQYVLPWSSSSAFVCIDMPSTAIYQSTTQHDLFALPHVSLPASQSITIDPHTVQDIVSFSAPQAQKFSVLLVTTAKQAACESQSNIIDTNDTSVLVAEHAFGYDNAQSTLYARMMATWAMAKLPQEVLHTPTATSTATSSGVEVQLSDAQNVAIRMCNTSVNLPFQAQLPHVLLQSALASHSMLEIHTIMHTMRWMNVRCSVTIRQGKIHNDGIDTLMSQEEHFRYIREIHVFDHIDEVRKNLLHQSLSDTITFYGRTIKYINRVR